MLKTIRDVIKTRKVKNKLLYTIIILFVIRMISQIPVPGVNPDFFKNYFGSDNNVFGFLNMFTGGGFERMSVFALSITPYITSSIIIQLMTISFPRLEQLSKEGESGRKKLMKYTQYVTLGLSILESAAMVISFKNALIIDFTWLNALTIVATLSGASMFLVWLGGRITENGIGNGISMILLVNIISGIPTDFRVIYDSFIQGKNLPKTVLAVAVTVLIVIAIVYLTLIVNNVERRIPVQYSQKMQGRRFVNGESSFIPLKINTSGVIPVIFAMSLMALPNIFLSILGKHPGGAAGVILGMLNSSNWFNTDNWIYTCGYILYALLIVFFAYFYTAITFNPIEIADNLKKAGAAIPGIRPGKPTELYLKKILKHVIMIGAIGLLAVCTIPFLISGFLHINVSFGGTSLIIITSVVLEAARQMKAMLSEKNFNTFLR